MCGECFNTAHVVGSVLCHSFDVRGAAKRVAAALKARDQLADLCWLGLCFLRSKPNDVCKFGGHARALVAQQDGGTEEFVIVDQIFGDQCKIEHCAECCRPTGT